MERADEVLAVAGIDCGLAADRGIDLRKQRGGYLHIVETAAHNRGGKAGEVADDAAAERHHDIGALDACGNQRFAVSPAGTVTDVVPMPAAASAASVAARW